tara:strand:+ start:726 stop:1094 length:369 start_codon:yes stop_codon:yes gene_type:complete
MRKKYYLNKIWLLFFLFDFSNAKNLINFIEWKTPSYETTADPDFDSLKRLGRAYFLLEQKKLVYSKSQFEKDLVKYGFSIDDINFLKNSNTIKYVKRYANEMKIMENSILEKNIIFNFNTQK